MKVLAVGTGCTWFERNNTSFILDDTILFDVPNGQYKNIIKKMDIREISGIFISHFHADHFVDIHVVLTRFMREGCKYWGRTDKLKVFGPKGLADKFVEIQKAFCTTAIECELSYIEKFIEFHEVENECEFEFGGYKVKVFAMEHGDIYSQGYTFTDSNGKVVGFTGDTKDCENLQKMLAVSNVAFVDMAAIKPAKAHLDVEKYIELEKEYKNCTMYAIHTSDETYEFGKNNNIKVLNDGDEIII